jgi:tetratricopeptide (TPR) repeat protein
VLVAGSQGTVSERDAERVFAVLRGHVNEMLTHTAANPEVVANAQKAYGVAVLDSIAAQQLAAQLNVQTVLWTELSAGGEGLMADVQFMDVARNDKIRVQDVTAPNANALAQAIFSAIIPQIEALSQAAYCNDYLSSSDFDRALTTCESALAVVPTSTAALYGKAAALLQLERHQEALDTYNTLLEIDNTHSDALLGAGFAASHLSQSEAALAFYNRYLALNPGDVQVRLHIAGRIGATGDYVSAFKVLEPAIDAEENRDDPEFQRFLFSLATAAGERVRSDQDLAAARPYFDTALQAYERAFATDSIRPDVAQMRQAIAVQSAVGNSEEALALARQATQAHDSVASLWSAYASALADANQHAEAVRALTRMLELDPEIENGYIRRGMANLAAGQRQQGLADLERAAQTGNRDNVARILFGEGNKSMQATRFAEAEGLFERAANYASGDLRAQIVFFQGFMIFRQGDAIARANGQGNVGPAREALALFRRARPLVQAGAHASKAQVLQQIDEYIANQEAIIQAGSR